MSIVGFYELGFEKRRPRPTCAANAFCIVLGQMPALSTALFRFTRLQFGLRTLLVSMALFAIPLAWLTAQYRWRNQRNDLINCFHPTAHFGAGSRDAPTFGLWLVAGRCGIPAMTIQVDSPEDERRAEAMKSLFPECDVRVERGP
jgi:hypothetical protein